MSYKLTELILRSLRRPTWKTRIPRHPPIEPKVFEVTASEILDARCDLTEQIILSILKDKGAPVYGTCWFEPRHGFEVTRTDMADKIVFEFRKAQEQK